MAENDSPERPKTIKILAIILSVHAAVTAFTWRDLATREPEQVRGSKRFWRMASGVNTLGTLLYFAAGRRKNAAPKG